jgi:hypothetical protein
MLITARIYQIKSKQTWTAMTLATYVMQIEMGMEWKMT